MELLLKNIARHVSLSPEEKERLSSLFEVRRYTARSSLLEAGSVSYNSYFVLSGILRSYTMDEHLVEHTISFATTNWWISDMYSFLSGQPGNVYIDAIEDALVIVLCRQKQLELFDEIPKLERYFRILIENSLVANQQRLMDNLSLSAEERYEKFCKRFPEIKHRIAQKHIASYLGITPEFFSKMKKELLRK